MTLSRFDTDFNKLQLELSRISDHDNSKIIVDYYFSNYPNLRTLTNKLSLAKKYFSANGYNKKYLLKLYPGVSVTNRVKYQNLEVLENTQYTEINKSFIDDVIINYPSSTDYLKLSVYLMVASGRRIDELLNSNYSPDKSNDRNVIVDKLLKKRDGSGNYSVRIIGDRDQFLNVLSEFKSRIKPLKLITIRQNIQYYINCNYLSIGLKTSHYFRVLYANYLFKYDNPDKLLYNVFLKKVLNHSSLLPSVNYSSIKILTK